MLDLGDLFIINEDEIPSSLFLNEDRNTLSILSYTIDFNVEIIKDIQIFKIRFTFKDWLLQILIQNRTYILKKKIFVYKIMNYKVKIRIISKKFNMGN